MNNNIIWQPTNSSNHREKQASMNLPGPHLVTTSRLSSNLQSKFKFKFFIPILSKINPALK